MEKNVCLFVCDNMADWEPALATAMISDRYTAIPKTRSYPIITFGLSKEPVTTFGGLTILPDADADEIDLTKTAIIILPGSSIYEKDDLVRLTPVVRSCVRNKIPVAAICGGTLFLARHGFLDTVHHTSCGPQWLKDRAPEYRGERYYVHEPCVADGGIITANPLGFVEFAYALLKMLDVVPPGFLETWRDLVKQGYLNVDLFIVR
jgi:putative intracellular protease/amidase